MKESRQCRGVGNIDNYLARSAKLYFVFIYLLWVGFFVFGFGFGFFPGNSEKFSHSVMKQRKQNTPSYSLKAWMKMEMGILTLMLRVFESTKRAHLSKFSSKISILILPEI